MGLLQKELEEVSSMWKNHRIRTVRNCECPAGCPAVIYDAPELFGGYESGSPVTINDLILGKTVSLEPSSFGCSTNFFNFASLIMHENNLQMPESISNSQQLHGILINQLEES